MSTGLTLSESSSSAAAAAFTNKDNADDLYAAVDMGTNSFKLLIVRADPSTGRFLPIDRHKEPVLLGLDATTTAATVISPSSVDRAIAALSKFQQIMHCLHIPSSHSRFVATSAVREASNQSEFLFKLHQNLNLHVDVLSGQEEAGLIYFGVLQFIPVVNDTVLTIDIGGGSTEIIIGKNGKTLHAISLKLGHVTLTQQFIEITKMREHVRSVIDHSGLVDKVKEYKIDKVLGSSGTIKAIEEAVYKGYAKKNAGEIKEIDKRDWRFNKEELIELVEGLGVKGKKRREGFFKKRAEFILAGAVLLEEIFEGLGIEEMEVSEFALGEGVIAEMLRKVCKRSSDWEVDVRWRSVVRLVTRLNSKKRMKASVMCAAITKDIFEGIKKWNEVDNQLVVCFEDKDLEYLEAACLLHNIGLYAGKKGYHKQSYQVIINGNHLQGYSDKEVKLIGLLVKHHRKKIPKSDVDLLEGFEEEVKLKFRMLCAILRLSAIVLQFQSVGIQTFKFSCSDEGFRLVLGEARNQPQSSCTLHPLAGDLKEEIDKEVENFRMVFAKQLSVMIPCST
ncbi:uncharacterized protein LOC113760395 isoform X1 [Coffea eugenioides]|uniref:uncharacterized protein LOC113760395 isoform X1 n=1 Tax=Coffea eugenioides TaxID=49369 RepID=UPI000F609C61|nr:uncharacterized protein LOC113760395 isoform X1 [Coffea eugenioides]